MENNLIEQWDHQSFFDNKVIIQCWCLYASFNQIWRGYDSPSPFLWCLIIVFTINEQYIWFNKQNEPSKNGLGNRLLPWKKHKVEGNKQYSEEEKKVCARFQKQSHGMQVKKVDVDTLRRIVTPSVVEVTTQECQQKYGCESYVN